MDKNYNVDDLLSEIKRRKTERKDTEDGVPVSSSEEVGIEGVRPAPEAFGTSREPRRTERPAREESRSQADSGQIGADYEPFSMRGEELVSGETKVMRPSELEAASGRNPLGFDGHVRPLTDRAKMRNRYDKITQQRQQPKLDFQMPQENKPSGDISSTQEHTWVSTGRSRLQMTSGTGRELRLEDIKKLDFGALSDEVFYDDEENLAESIPEGSIVDFSEYNSAADRRDVARDIANTKLWLFIRTALTAILTFILFYLVMHGRYYQLPIPPALFPEEETMRMYMIANTILAGLVAIVNSASVGGGLISLFKMRANSDTLVAIAVLFAIAQGVAGIMRPQVIVPEALSLYFPVAALAMLFNCLGKMIMIGRIQMNFRVLSSSGRKYAVEAVESERLCHELYRDPTRYRPTIAYRLRAGFFTDFLAHSYSDKFDVGVNRAVAPVCLVGALVVAVSTYFLTQSMYASVSTLTAILCVCATLSSTFIESIPLKKLADKLTPQRSEERR